MAENALDKTMRYRWLIFAILALGYVLVYFHRLCPAVVAVDMMRDLKASGVLTGVLGAAYFYPYAAMQLPAGLLSDSWGPRNTVTVFFCIAFLGSLILGWSPTVTVAIVGRTLVGFGVAMLFVPTMKILAEWFRVNEFAFMTGILMALGGIGTLISAKPLAVMSSWIGWRYSFTAVGIFTIIVAALVWLFVRDNPAQMGLPSPLDHQRKQIDPIGLMEGVRRVITCKAFWPLAIWFFFDFAIFFSFAGLWGGPYLNHIYGMPKSEASNILSLFAVGMIVGSPMLSYLSNNVFRARKPVIVLSTIMTVIISAVLAFYTGEIPVTGHYFICLSLGIFTSAIVVIGFTTNKELFPVQMAGTATGMINLFPFAGGAVFQPILGYALEQHGKINGKFVLAGYQNAFLILFICGIIALTASFFLKETLTTEVD